MGTPVTQIKPCYGCCCCLAGCNCEFPQCCGIMLDGVVLCCCLQKFACCRMASASESDEGVCFECFNGGTYCVQPKVCCKQKEQCCCFEGRCALPCDDETPCILTCLPCCALCVQQKCKVTCLKTVEQMGVEVPVKEVMMEEAKNQDLGEVNKDDLKVC